MVNSVSPVLQILLDGLFDYAGLFPPAQLSMIVATREFDQMVNSQESDLVHRFVCPIQDLEKLADALKSTGSDPVPISVLGSSLNNLSADILAMADFEQKFSKFGEIVSYEVKAENQDQINNSLAKKLGEIGIERAYIEIPWGPDMPDMIHQVASTDFASAKARTGGQTPESFPSNLDLAQFIHEVISVDLDFKLTAGLHHALPYLEANGSRHHGLLNVLLATALIANEDFTVSEAANILAIESREDIAHDEHSISIGEFRIDAESSEIARSYFDAIGSCSIIEPIESLAKLGLKVF